MRYVGIDVHQRMSSVCILDENGKKEKTINVRGPWGKLSAVLQSIPRPFGVCFEASNGYGFLYETFSRVADRVVVAHPGHLRLIFRSKRKNDRVDAEKLAVLLFLDQVPPVYVPGVNVREWRRLITFRTRLVQERTRVKNRLRGLLRRHGLQAPTRLWSRSGLNWLEGLELPTEPTALERDLLLDELEHCNRRIKRVETELNGYGKTQPGVQLLRTIPGVGPRTAEAVVAWVDRPTRFGKNNTLPSYFGLVPSQDASAGINRLGHITKQGPGPVRGLLIEAAWQAIRRSPEIRAHYQRLVREDPQRRKIAIVAVAHYLLRIMLALLKTGQEYRAQAP